MRKAQKQELTDFVKVLERAHLEVRKALEKKNTSAALDLLEQCQEGAIELGNAIEREEGEGFVTIPLLEEYCELTYQIHEEIVQDAEVNPFRMQKRLEKCLKQIANSIRNDIKIRYEVVFFPYKVAMWDSLESVWRAADADPDCNAYVVPIPYYDRNPDGSLGTYHYEGNQYPEYVPVVYYEDYAVSERLPDAIYIHNPYDHGNYVTSVDPRYYSRELKQYTDNLVYIPYYATSGGMSESQELCYAYIYADYIVIQSEKYRKFFAASIPDGKFLPFGSPKFDKVIRLCQNPPEPPESWKQKMQGKTVYFYNTSIGGMLADTETFLKKMRYVFSCFEGRTDACIIWRPHPLLDSTFASMRREFQPAYEELKRYYLEHEIGIYDDTPEIADTIALSDAYIGDSGTSVTSLFGVTGKPIFILNNNINTLPEEDDWRGEIIWQLYPDRNDDWMIARGNDLYHAPNHDYHYEYYCSLSEYSAGNYYMKPMEIGDKLYVCPMYAQDILVIQDKKIIRKIELKHCIEKPGAFCNAWQTENYIFILPNQYPAIVRYDLIHDKVDYIRESHDLNVQFVNGEWRIGGSCLWENQLFMASPTDNRVLAVDIHTLETKILSTGGERTCGYTAMLPDGEDIILLPFEGTTVACWNPKTGTIREYSDVPEGFVCHRRPQGIPCMERPFSNVAVCGDKMILSPAWGNMFVCIDKATGKAEQWTAPFSMEERGKNGYYQSWGMGGFAKPVGDRENREYLYFSDPEKKLYVINVETKEVQEVDTEFDRQELAEHEPGFAEESQWCMYDCLENSFHTLPQFLDGAAAGEQFDKEKQLQAYEKINASSDGTCGEKVHRFVMGRLR